MDTASTLPVIGLTLCLMAGAGAAVCAIHARAHRARLWELIQLIGIDQATMTEVERAMRTHLAGATAMDTTTIPQIMDGFRRTTADRNAQYAGLAAGIRMGWEASQQQLRLYRISATRRDNVLGRLETLHHQIQIGEHR